MVGGSAAAVLLATTMVLGVVAVVVEVAAEGVAAEVVAAADVDAATEGNGVDEATVVDVEDVVDVAVVDVVDVVDVRTVLVVDAAVPADAVEVVDVDGDGRVVRGAVDVAAATGAIDAGDVVAVAEASLLRFVAPTVVRATQTMAAAPTRAARARQREVDEPRRMVR